MCSTWCRSCLEHVVPLCLGTFSIVFHVTVGTLMPKGSIILNYAQIDGVCVCVCVCVYVFVSVYVSVLCGFA